MKLDKTEKRIEESILKDRFRSVSRSKRRAYETALKKAAIKNKRINIRLREEDLHKLKDRAEREGIPYQSLISGVLHKYVNDDLIDVRDVEQSKKLLAR